MMEAMDPRQERTWERLRTAVLERCATSPLSAVTVSDLARDAGISRDTFYRHADSPADLLARALSDELDEVLAGFDAFTGSARERFDVAERELFRHIHAHRVHYANAMDPWLAAPIRAMLVGRITSSLTLYLDAHPEVPPPPAPGQDAAEANRLYVAYGAAGTVGAVELWISDGAHNPDAAARAVLAVSAPWWMG